MGGKMIKWFLLTFFIVLYCTVANATSECKMKLLLSPNIYSKVAIKKSNTFTFRGYGDLEARAVTVILPGGPGLSASYLDSMAALLSQRMNQGVMILDYPNHNSYNKGLYELSDKTFSDLTLYIEEFLHSLHVDGVKEINLIGHSYGAIQAMNLLARKQVPVKISKTVLLTPVFNGFLASSYKMKSAELIAQGNGDFSTEEGFRRYWSQMLPMYFNSIPSESALKDLLASTTWVENGAFADTDLTYEYLKGFFDSSVFVIGSRHDGLVEFEHNEALASEIGPNFSYVEDGHFFMIESAEYSTEHLMRNVFTSMP